VAVNHKLLIGAARPAGCVDLIRGARERGLSTTPDQGFGRGRGQPSPNRSVCQC